MDKKYKIILALLIVILTISSYFFIKEIAESKKEKELYEELREIVQEDTEVNIEVDNSENLESANSSYNLENISKINSDVIGWIKIEGTNIDYPIMQNGYYLYRNIYKQYSSYGTPYVADYCNIKTSNNLIIYGHHMNDNTMFSQLVYYEKYSFYKNHKYIKFYTLENGQTVENTYEIIAVFKTTVYSDDGFKYYNYFNFKSEQEFNEFISGCKDLELYDTEVSVNYTDKLITLSTCEYSQTNGRMVVVAKLI